jgi:hypothetical protein
VSIFVFVVGAEVDLVGAPVGIDLENFLVAVAFAMNEREKEAAGFRAQDIFQ